MLIFTNNSKSTDACGNVVKIYRRWRSCTSKHHIRSTSAITTRVLPWGTNQEIIKSVSINIAGGGNGNTSNISGVFTNDFISIGAGGNVVKIYRRWRNCASKHHIRSAGSVTSRVLPESANQEVIEAVSIDVAGG